MKRILFATIMLVAFVFSSKAYDFQSGDLYYNITSSMEPYTVEITYEYESFNESNYSSLKTANIPSSVAYDGIDYSVTSIGYCAFCYCSGLTSVNIPNTVTSIDGYAFNGCSGLTSVTIPNSVTSINCCAFYYCSGLTSVTIPNSVTSIDDYAFNGCSGLTSINVASDNSNFSSAYGVLFNKNKTTLLCCPAGKTGSYTIPNSVTSIGDRAFVGCSGLTSVTIPNSVTSIGDYAFWDCRGLTSVTFAEDSRITSIGNHAFYGCNGLTSVTIPNSVTSIGDGAFNGCSGLTSVTIPNSVTGIDNGAFGGCSGLTSVTIPNSVTSIGSSVFYNCSGLTSINVAIDNSNFSSVDGVLFNKDMTTLVCYPAGKTGSYTIPNSVTSIGDDAFYGCSGLTSVIIPNSVTSIGDYAFCYCSGLTSVTFAEDSRLTSIGERAFDGCNGLTSVTIPNSVTSIGSGAFSNYINSLFTIDNGIKYLGTNDNPYYFLIDTESDNIESCTINDQCKIICDGAFNGCKNLNSIDIPKGVASIGKNAFKDCTGLKSVNLPSTVTTISDYAFQNCSGLTSINMPNAIDSIGNGAFTNCTGLKSVTFADDSKTTSIGESAFSSCTSLNYIEIPSTVTTIGDYAFQYCSGLTSINMPNAIDSIGYSAFANCTGLKSVTFADDSKPTSIGGSAFSNCTSLNYIEIPSTVTSIGENAFYSIKEVLYSGTAKNLNNWGAGTVYGSKDDNYEYADTDKKKISKYLGKGGNIIIPEGITAIGSYAFQNCDGLTSIVLPETITSIGKNAFYGCNQLQYNTDEYGAKYLGSSGNKHLCLIKYPGYSSNYNINDSCKVIADHAFDNCSSLTSISIPSSVSYIGEYAFYECTGLKTITIPDSVTSIGDNAFLNAKNIVYNGDAAGSPWGALNINGYIDGGFIYSDKEKTTLTAYIGDESEAVIPDGVTSIGDYAFYKCYSLNSIILPNSVTSIGKYAFYGCTYLKSFTIADKSKLNVIEEHAFDNCEKLLSITIPNSVSSIGTRAFYAVSILNYHGTAKYEQNDQYWGALAYNGIIDGDFIFADEEKTKLTAYIGKGNEAVIPNGVTSIGKYAFSECTELESITIPNSVIRIEYCAFEYCSRLNNVKIPDSVTYIGYNAFMQVRHIEYHGTAKYEQYDQYWGAKSMNGTTDENFVYADESKKGITLFIGSNAIVTIPETITSIDRYAFEDCDNLIILYKTQANKAIFDNVYIPTGVTLMSEEEYNDFVFEDQGQTIKKYLGKNSEVVIPSRVTKIAAAAFADCKSLKKIIIPYSVTNIGLNAFDGCDSLQYNEYDNGLYLGNTYNQYTWLMETVSNDITSINVPYNCNHIGPSALAGSNISSIIIPNLVTSIGEDAFSNCFGLSSVTIPNSVTSIGANAFSGCIKATIYCQASSQPTEWENNWNPDNRPVYWGCKTVKVIANNDQFGTVNGGGIFPTDTTIEITATAKEGYKFVNWSNGMTNNTINIKVTSDTTLTANFIKTYIINVAVNDSVSGYVKGGGTYPKDTTIKITAVANKGYKFVEWSTGQTTETIEITVSYNTHITAYFKKAFSEDMLNIIPISNSVAFTARIGFNKTYYELDTIIIPETAVINGITYTITTIGREAFERCSNLKSITIPNTITTIEDDAFSYCWNLTDALVPNSVTNFGYNVFNGCNNIEYVSFGNAMYLCNTETEYSILVEAESKNINECIIHKNCKVIANQAFSGCWCMESLIIPNSVVSIGNMAFNPCRLLKTLIFEDNSSLENIGNDAFYWCDSLQSVSIPNTVKHIGNYAFANCTFLKHVSIPNSVESIGENAFQNVLKYSIQYNGSLYSDNYWGAITSNYFTFDEKYYCYVTNDTTILVDYLGTESEVRIPSYISIIADYAFRDNTTLEKVTIPNTVQIVGNYAFARCSNLKIVNIEDPVYVIGTFAFWRCYNATIYCESSGPYRWDFYWNPDQRPVKWNYRFDKPNETANKMNMNIFAHHNIIVVENAETDIYVYDVAGNCIEHMEPCQSAEITMQHNGIYLVKIGSTTKRVAITM